LSIDKDASAVNDAIREPAPYIKESESLIVNLQRGLIDQVSGVWQTDAEVREMTGADEEYLAGLEAKSGVTYSEYMMALIKRVTLRVGTIDIAANPSLIENISIGDRDILFLGIIRATYGQSKEFQATCPHCAKDNDIVMNLIEDFPIQKPNVNLREPIVVKLRNGKSVKMRIPTTADSAVASKKVDNASAQNTLMISRCAIWDDGDRPEDVETWAKSLNFADRNKIVRSLLDIQAGPKLEAVNVPCAHCGEELTVRIDWISLLLS
jgi:hypothetical protein